MKTLMVSFLIFWLTACASSSTNPSAPAGGEFPLVKVADVDATILHDIRYFGTHNFLGRKVNGYLAPQCWLTKEAASALALVQADLKEKKLSLKVYDCYRPQRAVNDFVAWAKDLKDQKTKAEFYPRVNKQDAFKLGYIAEKSGHSRGSTVDLTLVSLPAPKQSEYRDGQKLVDCTASRKKRFADNTVDMGTGYDCFDVLSHTAAEKTTADAKRNRQTLKAAMEKRGFKNYEQEWWHFTLASEPFPDTYFDEEVK